MDYFLRFANLGMVYVLLPLVGLALWWKLKWYKQVVYRYPLTAELAAQGMTSCHPYKKILSAMRFFVLLMLVFLIAKPQLVDVTSLVKVEGIDIMLVLDLSDSMQFQDFEDDSRARVDIAKDEAIRFIQKRTNDALGLVIFGRDAVSRCPLTHDKAMLKNMVTELEIGTLDPNGTVLSTAIVTAANRLKQSKAKSKVMIVLTDGEPSPFDTKPAVAIEVAKKMGIKVYTVGIGDDKVSRMMHPFFGLIEKPGVNAQLLKAIAQQTGGQFFMARSSHDMRTIYDTIDKLEKTEYETQVFSNYQDIFMPFLWAAFVLVVLEVLLSSFMWFSI